MALLEHEALADAEVLCTQDRRGHLKSPPRRPLGAAAVSVVPFFSFRVPPAVAEEKVRGAASSLPMSGFSGSPPTSPGLLIRAAAAACVSWPWPGTRGVRAVKQTGSPEERAKA